MIRRCAPIAVVLMFAAMPAAAQPLGTFRWQLAPYGSVLNLNVTQQGSIYTLDGFESQCGGNASLPVSGIAVPQANGQVIIGVTTINENGRGLHTEASINTSNFNGTWRDNAGNTASNLQFIFNPGTTCPGGPRTGPLVPDAPAPDQTTLQALLAEIASLRERLAAVESRKD